MSYKTKQLDKELQELLNYGGIFFEDGEVDYAWGMGDLKQEVIHMRKLASLLNELATNIEADTCDCGE